jgi:hypothetical protein
MSSLPDPTDPLGRRTILKGLAGLGVAVGTTAATGILLPGNALAASPAAVKAPTIFSDAQWGARPARGALTTINSRAKYVLVHHMDNSNTTNYTKAHAFDVARGCQLDHFSRGWSDTGQHFTNSRGGFVMEGRHGSLAALNAGTRLIQGAHCPGRNSDSIGIENEGRYMTVRPPDQQYHALVQLVAYICHQYKIPVANIKGHRDFYSTDCPGTALYHKLPKLREDVKRALG